MNKKNSLIVFVVIVVAALAAYLVLKKQTTITAGQIRISANIPLTGPVTAWSGEFPNGFRLGIEDACNEYNIDPNTFKLDFQDNAGKPSQAASVVQKQLLSGFDVYLCGTSEAAKATVDNVDPLGVPDFIVAFDPFMAAQNSSRLRIMANSKIEAPLFIRYAKKQKAKSVFIIQLDSAYANEEFGRIVKPALEAAGMNVIIERYPFNTKDYKIIAQKAAQSKADLIFICGYSFHLRPLITDLRTNDLVKDGRVMGVMDVVDFLYDGTPKDELQGLVFACPLFDIPGAIPAVKEWRDRFKARFNRTPSYVPAYAYDNAYAIVRAYKNSGKVSVKSIRDALPFDGITGKIQLDDEGDIVATVTVARLTQNGQPEEVWK